MATIKVSKHGMYTRYTPVAEAHETEVEVKTCWQDGTSTTQTVVMSKEEAATIVPIPERKMTVTYKGSIVKFVKQESSAFDFYQPTIVIGNTEIILPFEIMKMKSGDYVAFQSIEGTYELLYPTVKIAKQNDRVMNSIVELLNK